MHLVDGSMLVDYSLEVNSKEIEAENKDQIGFVTEELICGCSEFDEIKIKTRKGILKIKIHSVMEAITNNVEKIDFEGYPVKKEKITKQVEIA